MVDMIVENLGFLEEVGKIFFYVCVLFWDVFIMLFVLCECDRF